MSQLLYTVIRKKHKQKCQTPYKMKYKLNEKKDSATFSKISIPSRILKILVRTFMNDTDLQLKMKSL